jgi:hypothetical protein
MGRVFINPSEVYPMQQRRIPLLVLLALLSPWGPAFAHHGTSGYYDGSKTAKVEGVVKEFVWRNPHCGLFVVAKDASGKEVTYALEMGSPTAMARRGYTRDRIKAGDRVVATFHPAFTNPAAGEVATGELIINGEAVITQRGSPTRPVPKQ